jgi:hypothetical protein
MELFTRTLADHAGLQDRADFSKKLIRRIRLELAEHTSCCRNELCIYAAGSLARLETGRISDLDLFFIADRRRRLTSERSLSRLDEIQLFSDLIRLNEKLALKPFSGDGEYLKVHELKALITGTGSSLDDSENLFTTRLLLLLESKSLVGDRMYRRAVTNVLDMYFRDGKTGRKDFRPLFLLNDILRYWRTLCLNYERDRANPGKPWWKRNLNLKFPRKLTVFSSLLAVIAARMSTADDFQQLTSRTPHERLAFALDCLADDSLHAEYKVILDDYESFLAAKSHQEFEDDKEPPLEEFNQKALRFDAFLHRVLVSQNIDKALTRFVAI